MGAEDSVILLKGWQHVEGRKLDKNLEEAGAVERSFSDSLALCKKNTHCRAISCRNDKAWNALFLGEKNAALHSCVLKKIEWDPKEGSPGFEDKQLKKDKKYTTVMLVGEKHFGKAPRHGSPSLPFVDVKYASKPREYRTKAEAQKACIRFGTECKAVSCEAVFADSLSSVRTVEKGPLKANKNYDIEIMGPDGAWRPICGHWFWDDDIGATAVCKALGFGGLSESTVGTVTKTKNPLPFQAERVGQCKAGERLSECSAGGNKWGEYTSGCGPGKEVGVQVSCTDLPPPSCPRATTTTTTKKPKLWRSDGRCGRNIFSLEEYRIDGVTAQCDPDANGNRKGPCCSAKGYCGNSDAHCKCPECTDYSIPPL